MTDLEQAQREYAIALKKERTAAQQYCACDRPMGKRGRFLLDLAMRAAADRQVAMAKLREQSRLAGVAPPGWHRRDGSRGGIATVARERPILAAAAKTYKHKGGWRRMQGRAVW